MREPEGIETSPPGDSSVRAWSKRREPDIRNVEAVGYSYESVPANPPQTLCGPWRLDIGQGYSPRCA